MVSRRRWTVWVLPAISCYISDSTGAASKLIYDGSHPFTRAWINVCVYFMINCDLSHFHNNTIYFNKKCTLWPTSKYVMEVYCDNNYVAVLVISSLTVVLHFYFEFAWCTHLAICTAEHKGTLTRDTLCLVQLVSSHCICCKYIYSIYLQELPTTKFFPGFIFW